MEDKILLKPLTFDSIYDNKIFIYCFNFSCAKYDRTPSISSQTAFETGFEISCVTSKCSGYQ